MSRVMSVPPKIRAVAGIVRATALAVLIATPAIASANPSGATVVNGTAVQSMPNASTLNITTSNGAVINWQQFGINPGEVTRFLQQGGNAAVLNRVVGGDPSAILGSLLSNGRVFLINPNGVVFGPNAVVDTAGLIVSTLNMSDEDFKSGRLHFEGDGTSGAIVNQGQIRTQGSVVLIAPRIENSGLVESADGGLLLAAGHEVTITSFEKPEIAYLLQAPENEVVNLGQLISNGGAASVFAGSIRHSGDINANSVVVDKNGRVQLIATGDVTLEAGSTVSASGASGGEISLQSTGGGTVLVEDSTLSSTGNAGSGGDVRVLGEQVGLVGSTTIDVSGRDGGGHLLVGGDYQGANEQVANARATFVGRDTAIRADALQNGDGGRVILWADDVTRAYGNVSARGGSQSGDGGFVEISGKHSLVFQALVDTRAAHGKSGTLLLDPDNIDIIDGGGGVADGLLPIFVNSVAPTTISEQQLEAQTTNISVQAADGITVQNIADGLIDLTSLTTGESFTLTTTGAGSINFLDPNDEIRTAGADIILQALGTGGLNLGKLTSTAVTGGNIFLTAVNGDVVLNEAIVSSGTVVGNVTISANQILELGVGGISAGDVVLNASNGISMTGLVAGFSSNSIVQLHADNSTSGDIIIAESGFLNLFDNGPGFAVRNQAPGGKIDISLDTGDLLILGDVDTAGDVFLDTPGDISQSASVGITAFVLNVLNAGMVDLSGLNNQVVGLTATGLTIGGLTLFNNSGASALGLNNISTSMGPIDITNSGGISVIGTIDASGGSEDVTFTESSADINGAGSELIIGNTVNLFSTVGGVGNGTAVRTDAQLLGVTTGGTGAAGNINIEQANATATSDLTFITDSVSSQSVTVATASGDIAIDGSFGDPIDDLELRAVAGSLLGTAGVVTGQSVNLNGAGVVSLTGTTVNAGTSGVSINGGATGTGVSTSTGSSITSAGAVSVTSNGNVVLGSIGITDIDAAGQNVTINSLGGGLSDALGADTTADVRSAALNISVANGVELDTDVTNLSVVNSSVGNVNVINVGAGVLNVTTASNAASGGSVSIENQQNGIVLGLASATAAAVNILAGTASGAGAISDGNGAAVNLSGVTATLDGANGIGTVADPIETALTALASATAPNGDIAIANTGTLTLAPSINTGTGSNIFVSSTAGLNVVSASVASGNNLLLDAGSGTLMINSSTVSASADLVANGAQVDVQSGSTVTGNNVTVTSSGPTRVDAIASGATRVIATNNATLNAGSLVVQGGSAAGGVAEIRAANTLTVNSAGDVSVLGGAGPGATASIDPTTVVINAANDIVVLAGTGAAAHAEIVANSLVDLTAGNNVDITGNVGEAVVNSLLGDVTIAAGAVHLTAGVAPDGDAVIYANSGAGTVDITTNTCDNCVSLAANPFGNSIEDQGIFAGNLNVMGATVVGPVPAGPAAANDDSVDLNTEEILVLQEKSEQSTIDAAADDDEDEDDDDDLKICR